MTSHLQNKLIKRKFFGNYRELSLKEPSIDFTSNDYLGLARSSLFKRSVYTEWKKSSNLPFSQKLGSTGSRLLTGNSLYMQELEDKIANFHGYETGVLFNCGYMANVGLISAISHENSLILYDMEVHASTHDGIRLGKGKALPFKHNDLEHLEKRLKNSSCQGDRFICIESIYSTNGSMAPLLEITQLAQKYEARLIIDEAHATGVCGPQGRGLVAEHQLTHLVFAQVITFGKALGTYGAIILGSHTLKQALINFATAYIYTTALPFHTIATIKCSYDLFPQMNHEREYLKTLVEMFRSTSSTTHIQPIHVKGNKVAKELAYYLCEKGLDVRPLLSPTVRRGNEMLRICLHAFNTTEEVSKLINHLQCQGEFFHA